MFAVVRTGGKQYRVAPGDKIVVEKIGGTAGESVSLGDILFAGEGAEVRDVAGLTVSAEIIAQAKADKIIVFKKRRRHNYRRKNGHRQQHTILRITAIGDQKALPRAAKQATTPIEPQAEAPQVETAAVETAAPAAKPARARKATPQAPLKVEGAESPMVDAPVKPKRKAKSDETKAD